jgi:hypothetical protein
MSDERTPTAEPVTPMRDDDAGCWQHGDESITTRIEPAERVIEHCTICGKDVGWTWQAAQRSTAEVTRFEVIDHRLDMKGRVLVAWPCSVELSYQDGGRTLKVFVNEPR